MRTLTPSAIWLLAFSAGAAAQTYTINTVAGGGSGIGVGAVATGVQLPQPWGVSVDLQGNIYVAAYTANRVYGISPSGLVNNVIGNGTTGFGGDGGAAASASLSAPVGLATDASGNLYIADSGNARVRKVTAGTNIITTVAGNGSFGTAGDGGPATSASLAGPRAMTVDSAGNLYIANDIGVIRKVAAGTGIITTIAGNGTTGYAGDGGPATSAVFNEPSGIAIDASGNLYIADENNSRIRKITAGTGIITTIAGNGTYGYGGDGGPAAGAVLYQPQGLAVDTSGNLYIADWGNERIRRVAAGTGVITTVAGNGNSGFSGDGGPATSATFSLPQAIAVDPSGNLYIADRVNARIRKVAAGTGIITTLAGGGNGDDGAQATSASLGSPSPCGVALDSSNNLYLSANEKIFRVASETDILTTIAGNGNYGYSGDGGAATSANLYGPCGIAVDSFGNLYIADPGNNRIRKVATGTSIITTVAGSGNPGYAGLGGDGGPATSATLYNPLGVAVDSSGNLYIADASNNRIRKVSGATGIITTVAGTGGAGYTADGGFAILAGLYNPLGVAVDSAGNFYIADTYDNRIRKVSSLGIISTVAGNGTYGSAGDGGLATSANLAWPRGVAVDSSANVYIADASRIWKVTAATGIITAIAGSVYVGFTGDGGPAASATLGGPTGVAVDSSGDVFIADAGNNRIRELSLPLLPVTLSTNPAGLNLTVDGTTAAAPLTFSWVAGSIHSLFAPNQSTGSNLSYNFASWSQGGAASQTISVSGTATYNATFQLLPPTITCPPGSGSPVVALLYTIDCTASGGVTPYAWSITAGALPNGMALNASTGVITGTPTTAGLYSFTVQAVDSNSPAQTATLNVGFQVLSAGSGCLVTAGTTTASPTTDGGVGYVAVTAGSACAWSATSNESWVTLYPGATSGTGNGSLPYFVTPNVSSQPRSGTLNINGVAFTINQPGLNASVNERFVRLLYRNFLGRLPDPGGLAYWQGLLDTNQYTKEQLGYFFFTAQEFDEVERFVAGQYLGILGRNSDYAGWNFHRTNIRNGLYGSDYQGYITNLFLGSTEYAARYGNPTNAQFVTLLYQNALERAPAPSEVTGWVQTLASGTTRIQVAEDFLNSQEFLTGQTYTLNVLLLYYTFLSRDPDASGFSFWLTTVQTTSLSSVIADFVDSAEFQGLIGP